MKFFYSAGAMGYGWGYKWHRWFNFPKFPSVTKTITIDPNSGYPFAIFRWGSTIYNHIALHNIGLFDWMYEIDNRVPHIRYERDIILSVSGMDAEMDYVLDSLNHVLKFNLAGIELNFSCPNVESNNNKLIPTTNIPIYLKLNHTQDPYAYDLDRVAGIRLNSVPCWFGGMSGKGAQKYNWEFIKKFNMEGLNVAGSSFLSYDDIKYLEEFCGCTEIGIGSTILLKPRLIEELI
jgi:hypothetical protein